MDVMTPSSLPPLRGDRMRETLAGARQLDWTGQARPRAPGERIVRHCREDTVGRTAERPSWPRVFPGL